MKEACALSQTSLALGNSCEKTRRFLASESVAAPRKNALYVTQRSRHNTPRNFNRPTPHVHKGRDSAPGLVPLSVGQG